MADVRLIDANALKTRMFRSKEFNRETGSFDLPVVPWHDIEDADTIDAAPVVHGRWVRANDEQAYFDVEYVCGKCQFVVAVSGIGTPILYGYKYCPNCGAKMDAKEDV